MHFLECRQDHAVSESMKSFSVFHFLRPQQVSNKYKAANAYKAAFVCGVLIEKVAAVEKVELDEVLWRIAIKLDSIQYFMWHE